MTEAPKDGLTAQVELDHVLEKNKKAIQFIEDVTSNADEIQKRVLAEILSENAHIEYLNRYNLDGETDQESFKRLIPVVEYEDLQPDIERIANGDTSPILCAQPISELLISSGTSGGKSKLIPSTEEELERRFLLSRLLMPVMNRFVQGLDKGKALYFQFVRSESYTPGGLVARPVLTSLYKSKQFKDKPYDPYNIYTSPIETILCLDSYQSIYSQLLCGLCQNKQVVRMGASFATSFLRVIQFLEKNWTSLCNDIRTGTLDARITDHLVREAVMKILNPDPELADFVENECSRDSWEGIINRLWPNTKYLQVIMTGTMSQYTPRVNYYSNGLPLASTIYASSECFSGLNLNPLCKPSEVTYTLIPTLAYFEFLPMHCNDGVAGCISMLELLNKEKQDLVDLVDVELGQEYELVVTTYAGLYRYRVGDVLRVAGFKNKAPQFYFVRRKNVILSIDADKTNEVELQNAVNNAIKHLEPFGASLIGYTSYADASSIPGH
ncbi:hypothetical protein AAC387_Pa07g0546 [Persea americana]